MQGVSGFFGENDRTRASSPDGNSNKFDRTGASDNDTLDDQEAFEMMEQQKVLANDPDSLPFFNALKTKKALSIQNNSAIKNMRKTKRLR